MTQRDSVFELDPRGESDGLVEELQRRYPGRADPPHAERRTYYDTFDWRLHRAHGDLALEAGPEPRLTWSPNHGARPVRAPVESPPAFARDLAPGPLRSVLEDVADVRRLLPLVEVEGSTVLHHVLDEEEKTVARIEIRRRRAREPGGPWTPLATTLAVHGLTGYDAEREGLVRFLKYRAGLPATDRSELEQALAAVGRVPGGDPSAFEVEFPAGATAGEAVRAVLTSLLRTMRRNEEGVLERLDPEHLHDFRVAVRRTRAVLGQLGRVFPRPVLDHYREGFRWLGSCTGALRDLDVLEIELPGYLAELPEEARGDAAPLQAEVHRRIRVEQDAVAAVLRSDRYARLLDNWADLLARAAGPSPEAAHEPALDVVGRATWKRYKRVLRRGEAVPASGDGEALHELRIECKKLRYLLELFGGLFDAGEVARAVRELKRLQNVLGTVHDLEVHAGLLDELLEGLAADGRAPVGVARTVGRLEEVLARRGAHERRRFASRFERFASGSNRRVYRHAFRGGR